MIIAVQAAMQKRIERIKEYKRQNAQNSGLLIKRYQRMVTVGSAPNLNLIWSLIYPSKQDKLKHITQVKLTFFPCAHIQIKLNRPGTMTLDSHSHSQGSSFIRPMVSDSPIHQ